MAKLSPTNLANTLASGLQAAFSTTGIYVSAAERQRRFDAKVNEIAKESKTQVNEFLQENKDLNAHSILEMVKKQLKSSNSIVLEQEMKAFEQLLNKFQSNLNAIDAEKDPDLFLKMITATREYEAGLKAWIKQLKHNHPNNDALFDNIYKANLGAIDAFARKVEHLNEAKSLTKHTYKASAIFLFSIASSLAVIGLGTATLPFGAAAIAVGMAGVYQSSIDLGDTYDSKQEAKFLKDKAAGKIDENAEYKSKWRSFADASLTSSLYDICSVVSFSTLSMQTSTLYKY